MFLLYALILTTLPTGSLAGDSWDDFANNLATDLAPIIQLFGEQVTKQFLSESTSTLDTIIFAMAPLGIITTVVSVIRVCGSPVLRAFIGRAQEGTGVAETELCSSTGRDICEMYQRGAITRVFGRPYLLEVIHRPNADPKHFYALGGEASHYSNIAAGVYSFSEYQAVDWGEDGNEKGSKEWEADMKRTTRMWNDEHGRNPRDANNSNPPNLLLNVGFKRSSRTVLWGAIVTGVSLQAAVLVFAAIITKKLKWKKGDVAPPEWGLPLTMTGTVLLCTGMFWSASLIERSTVETVWSRRTGPKSAKQQSTFNWIQPGGQTVGDQSFDPFSYSDQDDPLQDYITSTRTPPLHPQQERLETWLAVTITMIGFVLQFVGLRGLHSSVSVFQMGAVLVMAMVRAMLRTQRLDENDNHILQHHAVEEVQGHELDWLVMRFHQHDEAQLLYRTNGRSQAVPSRAKIPKKHFQSSISEEEEPAQTPKDSWMIFQGGARISSPHTTQSGATLQVLDSQTSSPIYIAWSGNKKRQELLQDWRTSSETISVAGDTRLSAAAKAFHYRARLCRMTSALYSPLSGQSKLQRTWPEHLIKGRQMAATLANVLAQTATLVLSLMDNPVLDRPSENDSDAADAVRKFRELYIGFQCGFASEDFGPNSQDNSPQTLYFVLNGRELSKDATGKSKIEWQPDISQLESAIALTLWSMRMEDKRRSVYNAVGLDGQSPFEMRRLTGIHGSAQWLDWAAATFNPTDTELISGEKPGGLNFAPSAIQWWTRMDYDGRNDLRYQSVPSSTVRGTATRFFGWHAFSKVYSMEPGSSLIFRSIPSQCTLPQMIAQDLYMGFLKALLAGDPDPLGSSELNRNNSNSKNLKIESKAIDRLVEIFVEGDLGTKDDAVAVIIPAVVGAKCESPIWDVADQALDGIMETRDRPDHGKNWEWKQIQNLMRTRALTNQQSIRKYVYKSVTVFGALINQDDNEDVHRYDEVRRTMLDIYDYCAQNSSSLRDEIKDIKEHLDTVETSIRRLQKNNSQPRRGTTVIARLWDAITKEDAISALLNFDSPKVSEYRNDEGKSILMHLVTKPNTPMWRYMLESVLDSDPDPDQQDSGGRTALSYACESGDPEFVKRLIEVTGTWKVEQDESDWTPLHYAIARGRYDLLKIVYGYEVSRYFKYTRSPTFWDALCDGTDSDTRIMTLVAQDYRMYLNPMECPEEKKKILVERLKALGKMQTHWTDELLDRLDPKPETTVIVRGKQEGAKSPGFVMLDTESTKSTSERSLSSKTLPKDPGEGTGDTLADGTAGEPETASIAATPEAGSASTATPTTTPAAGTPQTATSEKDPPQKANP